MHQNTDFLWRDRRRTHTQFHTDAAVAVGIALAALLAAGAGCSSDPEPTPEPPALTELAIRAGGEVLATIELEAEKVVYSVGVSLMVQEITVSAAASLPDATITINGGDVTEGESASKIPLGLGTTTVRIDLVAPSGTSQQYTLAVERAASLEQLAYIKASNTGGVAPGSDTPEPSQFGYTVAIAGNTMAVGAPLEASSATGVDGDQSDRSASRAGAVYVFSRVEGAWQQQAYIKASNTEAVPDQENDYFGRSLALSGNTLVVGAPQEDSSTTGVGGDQNDNAAAGSGAAYVFRRTGDIWQQEAYLKASNTGEGDNFGWYVAVDGDTLVVGSPREDSSATGVDGDQSDNAAMNSGATYVFRRSGTSWQQEAYLKPSNTRVDAQVLGMDGFSFGFNLALSGDTLVVGAPGEDSSGTGTAGGTQDDSQAPDGGAVYVFTRTGNTWQQEAYLKASNTKPGFGFGWTVALSGDTLAVGAPGEASSATGVGGNQDDVAAPGSGAVYVLRGSGDTWAQEAYIKASNPDIFDLFGSKVALMGDVLASSALYEASSASEIGGDQQDNDLMQSGAAYLFVRSNTTWAQQAYIKASNPDMNDHLGYGMAFGANVLAIGAPDEDSSATGIGGDQADNSASDAGAMYLFR